MGSGGPRAGRKASPLHGTHPAGGDRVLHSVLAVPATRTVRSIPTEVHLERDDGMPEPCVLSLDNMVLMPKAFLVERLCRLGPSRMSEVCEALRAATGC